MTSKIARPEPKSSAPTVWLAAGLALALIVLVVAWWRGGRHYPEASSPQGMALMRALHTACSSQSPVRLAAVERELEKAHAAGHVNDSERSAFRSIIELAQQDEWTRAAAESYRFAQDQVR